MRKGTADGEADFHTFQQFLRLGTIAQHPFGNRHLRTHRDRLIEANRTLELELGVPAHGNCKAPLVDSSVGDCQFDRLVEPGS